MRHYSSHGPAKAPPRVCYECGEHKAVEGKRICTHCQMRAARGMAPLKRKKKNGKAA